MSKEPPQQGTPGALIALSPGGSLSSVQVLNGSLDFTPALGSSSLGENGQAHDRLQLLAGGGSKG
jgi:hypothetical protein